MSFSFDARTITRYPIIPLITHHLYTAKLPPVFSRKRLIMNLPVFLYPIKGVFFIFDDHQASFNCLSQSQQTVSEHSFNYLKEIADKHRITFDGSQFYAWACPKTLDDVLVRFGKALACAYQL